MAGRVVAMTENTDPRPHYRTALAWVRTLLGHLVATVDRARVIGEGGDPNPLPRVVAGVPDSGWADALVVAEDKMAAVWADDSVLDAVVTVPWGRVPGRAAVWGYIREALVHGWDLAVATGQDGEADPATAEAVLAVTQRVMPAESRGGPIPFAAPVDPRPGAGPTERLANWCGHTR